MRGDVKPVILWLRRDLRLADHPALTAAVAEGAPVIPVFIRDEQVEALGAAPRWRLERGLEVFARSLAARGSRLILRQGPAAEVLDALIAETGAGAVHWTRAYDPGARDRDGAIKSDLKARGIAARSFAGHLLFEPWTVSTGAGGFYRVFTPYWKAVRGRPVGPLLPPPEHLPAPDRWPASDALEDWQLGATMHRGAAVLARHTEAGEAAAQARLDRFCDAAIAQYQDRRDFPAEPVTSGLSEYLSLGEISPYRCWHQAQRQRDQLGGSGPETFLKELAWREFAYHLMFHSPHILTGNWRPEWDDFPWREDPGAADVLAWKQGRTGVVFVDAAMRELWVTGKMHNRARMIVASFLTKHLMTHWRVGQAWFEETLTDWDPASNAMGWQWAAGSGPDAAPYFRIFNPDTQLKRFDPDGAYARAWIAEGQKSPPETALDFFQAVPRRWRLAPGAPYPDPVIELGEGRKRALAAYESRKSMG
ncbi:cryptochrome/photolyase family protein [Pseudodonghicola flavimaris]|uniref:Deoxyribodipyrimidine photo-lyase n=1 Tax=Pseudodonghicola flavimaris TaxID=3050036 RepID=A0ABT7F1Q2_9RHOB|nr:deoxyribodipyrimidine photo-lyase [Pseudodonghicola flavimaris]MDK3018529.1 deoxyribodipyrimidine photo-lyase [Pseudodonghicola flavimaris]